jgi:hypothetical protein
MDGDPFSSSPPRIAAMRLRNANPADHLTASGVVVVVPNTMSAA